VVNRSVPVILCTEEDVEGNHGATIGKIDQDMLFYLESRGIPEEMIYDMLSKAVVDSIKKKIGDEATIKRIDELTR
jgi:Fe-S cluster assembly scaffold protein SufB